MAESILNRIARIVSAAAEDSVDRLEKAGGEAVMREAIREADRAVDEVVTERDAVMARRLQAARQQVLLAKRVEGLAEKARFAVDSGRDDLAEAALSQQLDFEAHARTLAALQEEARQEEARLDAGVAALRARKALMEDALSAYLAARREAAVPEAAGPHPAGEAERRIEAAEQAFARVMAEAAPPRTDAGAAAGVAEIDALQRSAAIAGRLAALKGQRAAW
ncbi:PspA/IM30 family protein [Methylobacterium nonmethylotrophicum]|uniref:Phage shock protein A n=1 Tax=Methylobacterium nonmethylotrophicum TaxID=1141884 RepID=A0A4Z0NX62_9HYPH|nr:PspA/IM30 family protein [Methylobacterium nonmethylotrophicum]TGE02247.1 hypothetical protein EU555_00220 [Methylobacterium nonmethylotrophicum]